MSAVDSFRRAALVGRRVVDSLGMRPTTVTIRVETWDLPWNTTGATLLSTVDTVLSPSPKVTQESTGDASFFGGGTVADAGDDALSAGVYRIGPITPTCTAGGYAVADLAPAQTAPTMRVTVLLEGAEFQTGGERFVLTDLDATNALHIMMTVKRTVQS